jgi:hypothetical protein
VSRTFRAHIVPTTGYPLPVSVGRVRREPYLNRTPSQRPADVDKGPRLQRREGILMTMRHPAPGTRQALIVFSTKADSPGLGVTVSGVVLSEGTTIGTSSVAYWNTGQYSWSVGIPAGGQIDERNGQVTNVQGCVGISRVPGLSLCTPPGTDWNALSPPYPDPLNHQSPLPLFQPRATTTSASLGPLCGGSTRPVRRLA